MRRNSSLAVLFLIVVAFIWQTASAQIPKLPKIPKPSQPKSQPTPTPGAQPATTQDAQPDTRSETTPATTTATTSAPAAGVQDEGPAIAKDSIQFTAFTNNSYRGNFDVWSWVPRAEFRVNGPIESGSQLYVEYTIPGGAPVKFDCRTEATQKGYWVKTECGGRDIPEAKSTTYTGPVSFAIKMRNELAGTDATLFNGKMKVSKAHSNEAQGPKFVNHFVYYVEHDWNLPIGYVFLTPVAVAGWNRPLVNVAFWVRGDATNFEPHLFYNGKEVGKKFSDGQEVGRPGCDSEVDNNTTHYVADSIPQKAKWSRVACTFYNVIGWDKTGEGPGMFGPPHSLSESPGEYEFKLLWNNRLARSIKFTVAPGTKFENGIGVANKLGNARVIVPVTIIGDQDGTWDRMAWKTDAFYGNPLTGFVWQ
jgi:hypothetical protein